MVGLPGEGQNPFNPHGGLLGAHPENLPG